MRSTISRMEEMAVKAWSVTDRTLRLSYKTLKPRSDAGVLSFQPYASALSPLWRYSTVDVARKSAQDLWKRFEDYNAQGDFVGMDMTTKVFRNSAKNIKFYAKGPLLSPFEKSKPTRSPKEPNPTIKERRETHFIFREALERCESHQNYQELRRLHKMELKAERPLYKRTLQEKRHERKEVEAKRQEERKIEKEAYKQEKKERKEFEAKRREFKAKQKELSRVPDPFGP